jgi:hypothetical protein
MQATQNTTKDRDSASPFWDGFIPETEAADFLCQSVRTIQKWRVTGAGPHFYKFGSSVRYPTNTNRARWPNAPIWDMAQAEAQGDLQEMRSHVDPDKVKYVHRQEHIRLMMAQVIGNATTLAALEGVQESALPDYVTGLADSMAQALTDDPDRTSKKLEAARARYRFIEK